MTISRYRERATALELARPAVAAVAPEELPLLDATAAAYRAARRRRADDELLGFGVDEAVTVVSVAALGAAQAAIAYLGTAAVDVAREETTGVLRGWVRRRLGRETRPEADEAADDAEPPAVSAGAAGADGRQAAVGSATDAPAGLTDEQLRQVRRVATEAARAGGLDDHRAALVADAIVGRLSLDA